MKPCESCGALFAAPLGGRYCRPACRTAHWRKAREAEQAAERDTLAALVQTLAAASS